MDKLDRIKRFKFGKALKIFIFLFVIFLVLGFFFWLFSAVEIKGIAGIDFPTDCSGKAGTMVETYDESGELYDCRERTISDGTKRCYCQIDDPARVDYVCNLDWDCGSPAENWQCTEDHQCVYRYDENDPANVYDQYGNYLVDLCEEGDSRDKRCDGEKIIYELCVRYSSGTREVQKSYDCQNVGLTCATVDGKVGCYSKLGCGYGVDTRDYYHVGEKICVDNDNDGVFYLFVCDRSSNWKQVSIIPCKDLSQPEIVPEDPVVEDELLDEDIFDPETDFLPEEGCLIREQDCDPCETYVKDLCQCFSTSACFDFSCEIKEDDCSDGQVYDADFCQCFNEETKDSWEQSYLEQQTVPEKTVTSKAKDYIAEKSNVIFYILGGIALFFLVLTLLIYVLRKRSKK